MPRTRIKFCGMMHPDDAALAGELGIDAVGLIFHPPARRYISIDRARAIVAALPPFVTPVGLFVDADPQAILDTAGALKLHTLQLHGHESPETVAALAPFAILKAVRVNPATFESELARWRAAIPHLPHLRGLVLETNTPAAGGTGLENDWQTIRRLQVAGHFAGLPPVIAAGGLHPGNVAAVIHSLRPHAVDVSSGIEEHFGRKSPVLMKAFVEAVRSVPSPVGEG